MLPIAATQLLIALLLVAFWLRWHHHCKAKALREKQSRQQVAVQQRTNADLEHPPPKAVLVEQEPVIDSIAGSTSAATEESDPIPRIPTGITCVVRKGRKLLRCTEFEVEGELATEVVRVNKHGHVLGESAFHDGPFRSVADELLNLNTA